MFARVRPHLTYANVVSSLCLFLVLGGGAAFAKTKWIDGKLLKSRSVTGAKIKKHSLTGTEVNVKKLGRLDAARLGGKLPSAYLAARSTAVNAKALGGQPPSAYLPAGGTAANANALGGQPASAYLPAGRILAGSATTTAVPAQVVFTYPPVGLVVRTVGDANHRFSVSLAASTVTLDISHRGGITFVRPGNEWISSTGMSGDAFDTFVVRGADQPTIGLAITCGYDTTPNVVNCTGITLG